MNKEHNSKVTQLSQKNKIDSAVLSGYVQDASGLCSTAESSICNKLAGCEMTQIKKELYLQGDRYALSSNGRTLEQAERYRLRLKDDGLFAITRYYNGKFYVYLRTGKQKPTIKFENRAWRGTRLCNLQSVVIGDKEYNFEIGWHVPKNQYCVEVCYTYFAKPNKATYGSNEFYAETIDECLKWIESKFNVKTVCHEPIKS